MLFSVINQLEDFKKASKENEGVELRLDRFENLNLSTLKEAIKETTTPFIFTVRPERQGGSFKESEEKRLQLIEQLFSLSPPFFDLEEDTDPLFIKKMNLSFPHVKIILSFHDFQETPSNLEEILKRMKKKKPYSYKIATFANSSLDSLRMMIFLKNHKKTRLTALCMGELGQITRVLGKVLGSFIDYTPFYSTSPEKQLSKEDLEKIYNYSFLNSKTKIYALIGSPITQSVGHLAHNPFMKSQNGVYLKIKLEPEELPFFFHLIKKLPFKGLSVTTPLKDLVIPFQTINTLKITKKGVLKGYNTDGIGALKALEKKIDLKEGKIALLGAGSTAKAMAHALKKKGVSITIFNRTKEKGESLAKEINGLNAPFSDLKGFPYDLLINATSHPFPIEEKFLSPNKTIMEVSVLFHKDSLLATAIKKGCVPIYGIEMFIYQAVYQQKIWFKKVSFNKNVIEMEKILYNYLPLTI